MDMDHEKGMDRREFIRKAAITGAVAWAVPAIQTVAATPASAQTYIECAHSPTGPGTECPQEGNCKDACAARAQAECGKDCGSGCESVCADCLGTGPCNPCPTTDYCNPACYDVTDCAGGCTVVFTC
jgi:hypothetical protein